jgi:hypothetical protein
VRYAASSMVYGNRDIDNVAVQGRDSRAAASSGSDVASTPSTRRLCHV